MRKFILIVTYGTGKVAMLVDTPDMVSAIKQFEDKMSAGLPNTKDCGMPQIISAEILPVLHESTYKELYND